MPIRTTTWKVAARPEPLVESSLGTEQMLEEMIVAAPRLLSDEWMLIGRQEETGFGGRMDLLAVAPDGSLVLIELKRDHTPREVVAQALDYACWVERLKAEDIAAIYGRFAAGRNLRRICLPLKPVEELLIGRGLWAGEDGADAGDGVEAA